MANNLHERGNLTVKFDVKSTSEGYRRMKISHIAQPTDFANDDRWELVRRILKSRQFVSSARLRDFLVHVTTCALLQIPEDATEQQIGIRVFGRSPGFNTSEDSIVRSQARLLRIKLADYFSTDGNFEEIVLEIPKGCYYPEFLRDRLNSSYRPENGRSNISSSIPPSKTRWNHESIRLIGGEFGKSYKSISSRAGNESPGFVEMHRDEGLDVFWKPFFSGFRPMMIYSNEPFVGSCDEGLRYARVASDGELSGPVLDHLTGVGEVQSVFCITRLFESRGVQCILKRSSLVPWDDAKQSNLIFLGSSTENPALRVLPPTLDFTLAPDSAEIVNHHPLEDEPGFFRRSDYPLHRDYAVFSLRPGLMPGRRALIFAGLTTLGTQAAVEFACNPESISELLRQVLKNGVVQPFEAVLETNITGGIPLFTQLVALRIHS
jgi:hypothetical protein